MRKIAVALFALSLVILSFTIIFSSFRRPEEKNAPAPETVKITPVTPATIELPAVSPPEFIPADPGDFNSEQNTAFTFIEKKTAIQLADNISRDNIEATIRYLTKKTGARELGGNGNYTARQYLLSCLQSYGFSEGANTLARQGLYAFDLYTENVVAVIPAKVDNPKIIVLSAHFDSVSKVEGAVDNASGVALLLEIIRVLTEAEQQFDFELRFCFFSAEENGYYGAYKYISLQSEDALSRHTAVFNIDMAGYTNTATPKALVVSTKAQASANGPEPPKPNLISDAIEKAYHMYEMNPGELFSPTDIGKHDIVPFYKNGVPCATLAWREIDPGRADGNPYNIVSPLYMHTKLDCMENLDIDSVAQTTKLALAAFSILGERITNR